MRAFDYIKEPEKLLTPEIVQMIGKIHEHKGKQELFLEANIDELKTLLEVALIQSTGASNRIEGIYTTDKRLEELVSQKAEPRNRFEQEISGYREVLSTIHESYEYIVPRPNIILQLHRDLYSYAGSGGEYKNADNIIAETDAEGQKIETNRRVDITSVNDGKNYVCDEDAVSEIGWIWTSEIWEDVTLPGNLLRKAKARMQELAKGVTSMELTIVDESDAGADIGDIRARMYVRCISKPHGIDGTYLCLSRTVDYLNPAGNTITIGANGITLSSASAKQDQNISDLFDELVGVTGEIKTINEQKMYRTETYVDGVNIFRDKGQHSILRCRVFSWDKEITELLDASSFVWHRNSGDEAADADWDASHVGMKYITVTTEDVQDNTSFYY